MDQAEFTFRLSEDASEVHMEMLVGGQVVGWTDMDPSGISALIETLGAVRAGMSDPIPAELGPKPRFNNPQKSPNWWVYDKQGTEVPLALRHAGFGWQLFLLEPEQARSLTDTIRQRLPDGQ